MKMKKNKIFLKISIFSRCRHVKYFAKGSITSNGCFFKLGFGGLLVENGARFSRSVLCVIF
jgi:hypothetical protein